MAVLSSCRARRALPAWAVLLCCSMILFYAGQSCCAVVGPQGSGWPSGQSCCVPAGDVICSGPAHLGSLVSMPPCLGIMQGSHVVLWLALRAVIGPQGGHVVLLQVM